MKKLILVVLLALMGFFLPAEAQTTSAVVVTSCGTPPTAYSAGQNRQVTQDTTGTLCTGTGGGTANVNISQIGGAAAVNPAANTGVVGSAVQRITPAVDAGCNKTIPISQTASTDLHTFINTGYICSVLIVVPDAEVISFVEGTGTVCATNTAAIIGATTAANGMSFAANGGISAPSPYTQFIMATAADHACLLQSGAGRVAGVITYRDN